MELYFELLGFGPETSTISISDVQLLSTLSQPPAANNASIAAFENQPVNINLQADASDPQSLPLTMSIVGGPQSGTLTQNADGTYTYTPNPLFYGTDSFSYQASDGQFTSSVAMVTINVAAVNQAPVGASKTVATLENTPHIFGTADFGFSDPDNNPAQAFAGLVVDTLPSVGSLSDNGQAVTAGQFVSASDIANGLLVFTPVTYASGENYASFNFQVRNAGGRANGGEDTDPNPKTETINVTWVNQAPVGSSTTVSTLENTPYVFGVGDFGYSDPDNNPAEDFAGVVVDTLPAVGSLTANGQAIVAGQFVSAGDIAGGLLVFTPVTYASGANYAGFNFQVRNAGGTANGGEDTDPSDKTLTINVTWVNQTPVGVSTTVTTLENTPYVFGACDFGYSDPDNNPPEAFAGVVVNTLPAVGSLADNGQLVTAGQFVSASDIAAGLLVFTPVTYASGANYAGFNFQVRNAGGTANGGQDTDPTPKTETINVTWVNQAPTGASKTVATLENTPYVFGTGDFGYSDPDNNPPEAFAGVVVDTLPAVGSLSDNGQAVTAGQFVSASDIASGLLLFTPVTYASGANYASFNFQVRNAGGTANGGQDTDPSQKTATINVIWVNQAPVGASKTVTTLENTPYVFGTADFGYSDPDNNPPEAFASVLIDTLPTAGSLTDNGQAVTAGQFVAAADIAGGLLVFTPVTYASGANYASLGFQVRNAGGTANGGQDTDPNARTLTVNVTWVNQAPMGSSKTVTTLENTAYVFGTGDFGYSDPHNNPAEGFAGVVVDTLPAVGSLTDNGQAVTAGQFVAAADIASGLLVFTPVTYASGANYASLGFQVRNAGGTANGGQDTDPNARTLTVNVTWVNQAPMGSSKTVATLENTAYVFGTGDFGYSDPHNSPAEPFIGVSFDTLPVEGTLTDNGQPVAAGQLVSASDIAGGLLVFTPATYTNGTDYASFNFQVVSAGGTANGGADTDPNPKTITVNVTRVNQAPQGTSSTVTTLENSPYVFSAASFGYSDPHNGTAEDFAGVTIDTLPAAGALTDNGQAVSAGQFVTAADIANGLLLFMPAQYANGAGYASFNFQVRNSGGTADPSPKTLTINVTAVNQAPQGISTTVSTLENTPYTFTLANFGYSDPHNNPAQAFAGVIVDTLPAAGSLTDNGQAVTVGQFVAAADIAGGLLVFTPAQYGSGASYAGFNFQVENSGGTANGGQNTDPNPKSMTISVTWVNQAPVGASKTVNTLENTPYVFGTADFGYSDPHNNPAQPFLGVTVDTLPAVGALADNGHAVTVGEFISASDIAAGLLVYTPASYGSGANYASFQFQVENAGGTANGGHNTDPTPKTATINVTWVNQAPMGASKTVTTLENTAYVFGTADFGYSDPHNNPAQAFAGIVVDTLPAAGTLSDNGHAVTAGQFVSASDIANRLLVFTPVTYGSGANYASFQFQVENAGGTANGGQNTDPNPKTEIINVTWVNQAPVGTSKTVTTLENTAYVFGTADFGYSDPHNNPAQAFYGLTVDTLPAQGSLTDNGKAVTVGQFVSASDIAGGLLVFTPVQYGSGSGYASFNFQVENSGGTANGGHNTDATPRTVTVNVTWVNQAPVGTSKTVTTLENTAYVFAVGDFGYSDPHNNPSETFLGVKVDTLPGAGSLSDNGAAVTVGEFIAAADISGGKLVFTPATYGTGSNYASFAFQVENAGGTANGGQNTDPNAKTLTVSVTPVTQPPQGTSYSVTTCLDVPYTFCASDFGFSDPHNNPANTFAGVKIDTLPVCGELTDDCKDVSAGQIVSAADIAAGKLVFTPGLLGLGNDYASFTFQVQSSGSTANGGQNLDPTPRTMTINVTLLGIPLDVPVRAQEVPAVQVAAAVDPALPMATSLPGASATVGAGQPAAAPAAPQAAVAVRRTPPVTATGSQPAARSSMIIFKSQSGSQLQPVQLQPAPVQAAPARSAAASAPAGRAPLIDWSADAASALTGGQVLESSSAAPWLRGFLGTDDRHDLAQLTGLTVKLGEGHNKPVTGASGSEGWPH